MRRSCYSPCPRQNWPTSKQPGLLRWQIADAWLCSPSLGWGRGQSWQGWRTWQIWRRWTPPHQWRTRPCECAKHSKQEVRRRYGFLYDTYGIQGFSSNEMKMFAMNQVSSVMHVWITFDPSYSPDQSSHFLPHLHQTLRMAEVSTVLCNNCRKDLLQNKSPERFKARELVCGWFLCCRGISWTTLHPCCSL